MSFRDENLSVYQLLCFLLATTTTDIQLFDTFVKLKIRL